MRMRFSTPRASKVTGGDVGGHHELRAVLLLVRAQNELAAPSRHRQCRAPNMSTSQVAASP
jgi:hypothetical protein